MDVSLQRCADRSARLRQSARLARQLSLLQRATSLEETGVAIRDLLSDQVPSHSLSIYLNYFNVGRNFQVFHHQSAPGAPRPWAERRRFSPTPAYLRAHVGQKHFGLAELIPDTDRLHRTDYFKKVMSVEGWRSLFCLVFWRDREPFALLAVRRGGAAFHFTGAEVDFLRSLHEQIEAALVRIQGRVSLQRLSACEREVAQAARAGLGNLEIALKLGKAESTVKAQLFSAFAKLGIKRRSQLATLWL